MSTAAERATWKALAEGATDGPVWDRYEPGQCCDGVCIAGPTGTGIHDANVTTGLADFIAAARTAVPALLADVERLERENQRLTHLLGSHADGHRCTCECIRLADYVQMTPSEWEQDPWCPTHPDVDQIRTEFEQLKAENRRLREADL